MPQQDATQQDAGAAQTPPDEPGSGPGLAPDRVGADWWSVIIGGAVVVLAALNLLPRIPW